MLNLFHEHPLDLYIFLDRLSDPASHKRLAYLQDWASLFAFNGIRIRVFCTHSNSEVARYQPFLPFPLCPDPDRKMASSLNCTHLKQVFGRQSVCLACGLVLLDQEQILLHRQKIVPGSLEKVFQVSLQCQNSWLKENFLKFVDSSSLN